MPRPVSSHDVRNPRAIDHVEIIRHELVDHPVDAWRMVRVVAIDQNIDVRIHISEHASDHVALALQGLGADNGTSLPCQLYCPIARVVIVDIYQGFGKSRIEVIDDSND